MSALRDLVAAVIGPSDEEVSSVGHQLIREADALSAHLARGLQRVITVADVLRGLKIDLAINFSTIDVLRKRGRALLAARPQALFTYQGGQMPLADALALYESAAAACDEWRPKK